MMPGAAGEGRREEARRLLAAFDLDGVARWAAREPWAWRGLQSLLLDAEPLVGWRAVEACGRVASVRAARSLEVVRESLRRTLWLMNDESGGLLWCGPQVLGAVLANVRVLCEEFVPLLAGFLEEEPFRAGTRWALWRLAAAEPAVVASHAEELLPSLGDPAAPVRGHAALVLRALGTAAYPAALAARADDTADLVVFDHRTGELRATTVAALAVGAF